MVEVVGVCARRLRSKVSPRDPSWRAEEQFRFFHTFSVTGGDRASVVLSEPLNGGSPEVRVTGPGELQERCKGDSAPGVSPSMVPPHGFSEKHAGPIVDHLTTFD